MIQVLHRAFDILELCARNPEKILMLSDIADKLELNHGTCANIMKTLVARNYIEQVGYKKGYRLGAMAYHLTGNFSFRKDLVQIAKAPMQELVEELNETCLLAILRKTDLKRVVLYQVNSNHDLMVRTSTEKEAYNSSTGRLLLAYLTKKEIESAINKFGLPGVSIWPEASEKEKMYRELERIRKDSFAFQFDGNHIVGLAVPVFKEDEVIASLSIYLPEMRYQGEMKKLALDKLQRMAQQVNDSIANNYAKF